MKESTEDILSVLLFFGSGLFMVYVLPYIVIKLMGGF